MAFTRDLRLHDHPALSAACASGRTVVPLFVMEPSLTDPRTTSANRLAFLWESLADLRASLILRGANLYVRRGDAVTEIMKVVAQTGASSLFASEDVSRLARRRQQRLERSCLAQRCRFELFSGVTGRPSGTADACDQGSLRRLHAVLDALAGRTLAECAPGARACARPAGPRGGPHPDGLGAFRRPGVAVPTQRRRIGGPCSGGALVAP